MFGYAKSYKYHKNFRDVHSLECISKEFSYELKFILNIYTCKNVALKGSLLYYWNDTCFSINKV